MNKKEINYNLYLCTDKDIITTSTVKEAVELAIKGGVSVVQLREKDITTKEYIIKANTLKEVTDKYNVPLIINDRVDIAKACDCAGVHLGRDDLPVEIAREILGEKKIIGMSVATIDEAKDAEKRGADYIGVGAMFTTTTKTNTRSVSVEMLKQIKSSVNIPVVAIGGINENNIIKLKDTNIDGVAVISAIIGKKDITKAANRIHEVFTY